METDKKKIKNGLNFWGRIMDLSFWTIITMLFITMILVCNKNSLKYKVPTKLLVIVDLIPLIIFILALISYKGWKFQLEDLKEQRSKELKGLPSYLSDEQQE